MVAVLSSIIVTVTVYFYLNSIPAVIVELNTEQLHSLFAVYY